MNISLDYDDTYTRDPAMWNTFIENARAAGHNVYVVTMRYQAEAYGVYDNLHDKVTDIICTSRQGKRKFCFAMGLRIDVWIDDTPDFILHDAAA